MADTPILTTWQPPAGEPPSTAWQLTVDGREVFVYQARVREATVKKPGMILTHDFQGKADQASFALFDIAGPVDVRVKPAAPFKAATVLPTAAGIAVTVTNGELRFRVERPRPLTVLLDGSDEHVLHLFIRPPETNVPDPADPKVHWFGPGYHDLGPLALRDGETVYLAGGAVVRAVILPGEEGVTSSRTGLTSYRVASIQAANAKGVRIAGRGILDGYAMPHGARNLLRLQNCEDAVVEGITLRDSPNWHLPIVASRRVEVAWLATISGRLNSDGINCVNSSDVHVHDCFVRGHDDSLAVKANRPEGESANILYERCTVWNDWGYAIGVTYENRAPIHHATWRDCDILNTRHWAIGVYINDSGTVSDILFDDIRIEDLDPARQRWRQGQQLIRMCIEKSMWGTDPERGHIRDVTFRRIAYLGPHLPRSSIQGFDAAHLIERVTIDGFTWQGRPLTTVDDAHLEVNPYTADVVLK